MVKRSIKFCLLFVISLGCACYSNDNASIITQEELVSRMKDKGAPTIIDVRTANEYEQGHIPGAINIPMTKLGEGVSKHNLKPDDELVVYCESGARTKKAKHFLRSKGYFEVRHLKGDMKKWRADQLPCEGC